ncbi:MAG: hypothetical protein U0797_10240 [Gemmataceae bacterium]
MTRNLIPLALVAVVGCFSSEPPTSTPSSRVTAALGGATPVVSIEGSKLMEPTEPAGAKGVIEVRKEAKDGEEVTVVGRVGGAAKPFTDGRASFLIADTSLKPTDGCETPWDYCEYPKQEVAAARLSVKFVNDEGKTLQAGARETFGLKELSTVVVKGKVQRDDKGNVVVVGKSLFVRQP